MTATKQISIKVDPFAWESANQIFKEYGITANDAINMFLNQVILYKELPFEVKIPSDRLQKAIDEANNDKLAKFDNLDDFIKDLKGMQKFCII